MKINCGSIVLRLTAACCILLLTAGAACNQSREQELRQELTALRAELSDLKRLRYEIRSLEDDLQRMRGRLAPPEPTEDKRPIIKSVFEPDGSHRDDPFLGPRDAETIVMAFGDFQCRPCRTFYDETFPKLKEHYTEKGKIRFIYRDFPLRTNPQAQAASSLAHCAGEQGEYWQMFDKLFRERDAVDEGRLLDLAKSLDSVDTDRLKRCFESGRYDKELQDDISEGIRLGARGAPGFFIGRRSLDDPDRFTGVFVRGAQPFPVLQDQIERRL